MICDACETVAHCLKHGCVPITSDKSASAEAGKGEPIAHLCSVQLARHIVQGVSHAYWLENRERCGVYDVPVYTSESVAVSGEVSDSQINEVIRRIYGVEGTPRWATLREFARAVLALAGSGEKK